MRQIMPLKKAIIEATHEALPDDPQENRKAIKTWHNRLYHGSIPRSVIVKLGRELFLDLQAWVSGWKNMVRNLIPPRSAGRGQSNSDFGMNVSKNAGRG
jgi:hypothetical protein